eukprot:7712721-Pyramimonas_sp.AAC.1
MATPPSQASAPSVRPPPPPAPATVALFGTSHRLSACGKKCERCRGNASLDTRTEWLQSECCETVHVSSHVSRLPRGFKVHLGGGWIHPSHSPLCSLLLHTWICSDCGFYGADQLRRNLSSECPKSLTTTTRRYLDTFVTDKPLRS